MRRNILDDRFIDSCILTGASVPDTPPVVVIDAGSMYTKAGLHTDESPLQYQTVVGRPRHQGKLNESLIDGVEHVSRSSLTVFHEILSAF